MNIDIILLGCSWKFKKIFVWSSGKKTHLTATSIISLGALLVWTKSLACHCKVCDGIPVPLNPHGPGHSSGSPFPKYTMDLWGLLRWPHPLHKVPVVIFGAFLQRCSVVFAESREQWWGQSWKILWRNVIRQYFSVIRTIVENYSFFLEREK